MPRRVHETEPELDAKLSLASNYVAQQGEQLTPIRRAVLRLLYLEGNAIGAYDLAFKFQRELGRRIAPNTVYRALDFLVRYRLTAHVASQRAFVGLRPPETGRRGASLFFLCNQCGRLREYDDPKIERAIQIASKQVAFSIAAQNIEIAGLCRECSIH